MTPKAVAKVCHEVNKAYCESLGDMSQVEWDHAPEWQKDSALQGVKFHLSGDYGPEASHESWMKQKVNEGWVYGEVKDPEVKTHPCIVPFDQLPKEQQAKDFIFRQVVHSLKPFLTNEKMKNSSHSGSVVLSNDKECNCSCLKENL